MIYRILTIHSDAFTSRMNESCNSIILHLMKKLTSYRRCVQLANCSTAEENDTGNLNNETDNQVPLALRTYMQTMSPKLRAIILQKYPAITRKTKKKKLYLINPIVAKEFVSLIKDDLLKNATHVIEFNPGFGFITKELLKANVPFINLCEPDTEFYVRLKELCYECSTQLNLMNTDFFDITKLFRITHDRKGMESICRLLSSVQKKKWKEESCMQLIGVIISEGFLRYLIMSTIFQSSIMTYGRPIFYLIIPPSLWNKYNNKKLHKRVMFETLFNCKVLGEIDRNAFIPWEKRQKCATNNDTRNNYNSNVLFVVKLEPKPDLFELFDGQENLLYFWHFVRQYMYHEKNRVIPALEKVIPGCGLRLIAKNYNIYTIFSDLSTREVYDLFCEFLSWPEFKESIFTCSAIDVKKMYDAYVDGEPISLCTDDH